MSYSKVIPLVDFTADVITEVLTTVERSARLRWPAKLFPMSENDESQTIRFRRRAPVPDDAVHPPRLQESQRPQNRVPPSGWPRWKPRRPS